MGRVYTRSVARRFQLWMRSLMRQGVIHTGCSAVPAQAVPTVGFVISVLGKAPIGGEEVECYGCSRCAAVCGPVTQPIPEGWRLVTFPKVDVPQKVRLMAPAFLTCARCTFAGAALPNAMTEVVAAALAREEAEAPPAAFPAPEAPTGTAMGAAPA